MSRAISSLITVITVVAVAVGSMSTAASANETEIDREYELVNSLIKASIEDAKANPWNNPDVEQGESFTVNNDGVVTSIGFGAGYSEAALDARYEGTEDLGSILERLVSAGKLARGYSLETGKPLYSRV